MRTGLLLPLLLTTLGCSRLVDLDGLTGGNGDAGQHGGGSEGGAPDSSAPEGGVGPDDDGGPDTNGPHDGGKDTGPDTPEGGQGGGNDAGPDAGVFCPSDMALIATNHGAYCIDKTEVTQGRYKAFLDHVREQQNVNDYFESQGCVAFGDVEPQSEPQLAKADFPMGGVTYCGAEAFCKWAGKSLCGQIGGNPWFPGLLGDPRDAWGRACKGPEGRAYPYGDTFDMDACNGAGRYGNASLPVGHLETCVSPDGVFDMSGNVWEWVKGCDGETGPSDPCLVRGGSSITPESDRLKCDAEPLGLPRGAKVGDVGFRCCLDL